MVDPIRPGSIPGSLPIDNTGGTPPPTTPTNDDTGLPPISEATLALFRDALPQLVPPLVAGNISLDELVKAVGLETRQIATKTGLETLKAKAAEAEENNKKEISELQKQLEKMREKKKLSPFMKALKWIGMALAAIATVVTTITAVATANPLLIAGAAFMAAMLVNSIMSEASDGKISLSAGVAELAKKCGASEETAQWIGMGFEIGVSLIGTVLSFGAGFSKSVADAMENVGKVIEKVAKIAQFVSLVSGLNTISQGGLGIADSVYTSDITKSQATQKELEAIMARIMEAQDIETKFLESIMKRAEELLSAVQEIVQGSSEAQAAILVVQAPAVA
jgi:hypothetical protein